MSDSNLLAKCDMVLAISEDTINYQFAQLLQDKVINTNWNLLVRKSADGKSVESIKTQDDPDFDTLLKNWQAAQADLASLLAKGDYVNFGQKLAEYKNNGVLYDYGWASTIDAPTIKILQQDTQNLLFNLNFKSGLLYAAPNPTNPMQVYDLGGVVYAFKVPIGRIEINNKEEILTPTAKDQVNKVIQDSGLSDMDFTIESLFMNFENAEIASFDEADSKFPPELAQSLQITIEDYFKLIVAKNKNPFILGYGLSTKKLDAPTALFQPKALHFSTSYSDKAGCNAFNFLMMSTSDSFPAGTGVGVLPYSLLETASDISSMDGILAIDYMPFQQSIIKPFIDAIHSAIINKDFSEHQAVIDAQKWSQSAKGVILASVDDQLSNYGQSTNIESHISCDSAGTLSNSGLGMVMKTTVDYSVDIKIIPYGLLFDRYVDGEAWLSTKGQYSVGPDGKNKGQPGEITISINTGAGGLMDIKVDDPQPPYLGYDKKSYNGEDKGGATLDSQVLADMLAAELDAHAKNTAVIAAQAILPSVDSVKSSIEKLISSINNGKVILPLGEIYSFNNVRLTTNNNQPDNPVLFDVKYDPQINSLRVRRK